MQVPLSQGRLLASSAVGGFGLYKRGRVRSGCGADPRRGELGDVQADLGDDGLGGGHPDAGEQLLDALHVPGAVFDEVDRSRV